MDKIGHVKTLRRSRWPNLLTSFHQLTAQPIRSRRSEEQKCEKRAPKMFPKILCLLFEIYEDLFELQSASRTKFSQLGWLFGTFSRKLSWKSTFRSFRNFMWYIFGRKKFTKFLKNYKKGKNLHYLFSLSILRSDFFIKNLALDRFWSDPAATLRRFSKSRKNQLKNFSKKWQIL